MSFMQEHMSEIDRELRELIQKDMDYDRARIQQRRQEAKAVRNDAYKKGVRAKQWSALANFKSTNSAS